MLSTQSLREQLDSYSDGAISAETLEEWLAAESWDMRRWVPAGVQRLVEAMQAMFIQYSDGRIAVDQVKDYLLQRREQLHRAAEITKEIEKRRALLEEAFQRAHRSSEASVSESQALPLTLEPASA